MALIELNIEHFNATELHMKLTEIKMGGLVCNQFSRGVFSMLGAVSPDSFDTLHSYCNTFQMPFITPWFPEKIKSIFTELFDINKY
uniref:Receptor ligand binding region domain-containing protein n=1 Tax=Phlebotomus papatasi TaxID=29031 RepID=A0A1B0GNA9_PHLPP